MTEGEAEQLYGRWLGLWNGDVAAAAEILAPHFEGHWPGRPSLVQGPTAMAEMVAQSRASFSALSFATDIGPVAGGDCVAARWRAEGVYEGGIQGATAAAGTHVAWGGADMLRIEGGRIAEYWVSSDVMELLRQLGVNVAP